jgi:hypothetical protein
MMNDRVPRPSGLHASEPHKRKLAQDQYSKTQARTFGNGWHWYHEWVKH